MEHQGTVSSLVFSPDGRILVSTGSGVVRFWDAGTCEPQGEPLEEASFCMGAQFSPDGANLLIPGPDLTVRLWSLPAGRQNRASASARHGLPIAI